MLFSSIILVVTFDTAMWYLILRYVTFELALFTFELAMFIFEVVCYI